MPDIKLTSPLPNYTRKALKLHNWQIDNIALLLNKYLDFFLEQENQKELLEVSFPKNLAFSLIVKDDEVFKIAMNKIIEIKHSGYEINKNKLNGKFFTNFLNCDKRKLKNKSSKYENVSFSIKLLGKNVYSYNGKNKKEEENKQNCELINKFLKLRNRFEIYRDYLLQEMKKGKIKEVVNKIIERQYQIADCTFKLKTQTRLIVGLGSGSVLETSIKLHHIYGVPYIPASAVKGVLRAYRIWKLIDWNSFKYLLAEYLIENYQLDKFNQQKEKLIRKIQNGNFDKKFKEIDKELSDEDLERKKQELIDFVNSISQEEIEKIVRIFGNQQQKGKLIVLDAYPTNFEGFDIDIMNPHFPDYYDKGEPPADWQNPNPITFLTIPENTEFNFYFKNTSAYGGNLEEDLKKAFEYIGIGAKTAIGYGILE